MSMATKIVLGVAGLIAVLISVFIVRTYSAAGQYTSLPKHGSQACSPLAKIVGAEDIVLDRKNGVAFISSLDRRVTNASGEIFTLDLTTDNPTPSTARVAKTQGDFTPLGISFYRGESGIGRLFVINKTHGKAPRVELYNVVSGKLEYVKSISSPLFLTPNNLVAVGLEQFYLTNDGLKDQGVIQAFMDFANQKPKGNVVYFDGATAKEVATGFVSPNGIAKSNDGKIIYVNDMHARKLNFYKRLEDNGIELIGDLFVGTGLDNIDVDEEGHIWLAAHPKLFDQYKLAHGSLKTSPSQIIEAVPGQKEGGKMRTVFLDKGTRLSGSSIGVRHKNRILISGGYENKIISCDIPKWNVPEKK